MPIRLASIPLALAAFVCGSAAFAQEVASFTELSACRIDAQQVLLRATYDGGACQNIEPASFGEDDPAAKALAVILPSVSTSDMCTMQIVPVSTEQAIAVDAKWTQLDVTALDPRDNPQAHGLIDIAEEAGDCAAPAQ